CKVSSIALTIVMHTLKVFTSSSQIARLPEFWEVTYVDGIQILHFDSNSRKTKAKLDWVNKITAEDPEFWKQENENNIVNESPLGFSLFIVCVTLSGVHLIQRRNGCEWVDETDDVHGWEDCSYDGGDLISFEPRTTRWIAAHPQASITKNKLDQNVGLNEYKQHSLPELCPFLLKNHVSNGRDFLMRTVTCHPTGFYPATSALFWRKDDKELHEYVESGKLLPNRDGTFQTTAHLKVEVTPDAEGEYECVFQLAGVKEAVVVKLDSRSILSNAQGVDVDIFGITKRNEAGGFDCRETEYGVKSEEEMIGFRKNISSGLGGGEARAANQVQCVAFDVGREVKKNSVSRGSPGRM
uniref:Ig-like domain-containing protein n=1 Tax=Hippocampus comes TaxID=109280 RepID=A0A3Q2XVU0_HIPCM